ncbi:protein phosphatase 1 regulatory subunit 37 [Erpetoichthys calabaricus]|uniref:protein phosphatase 1 regulatory subunit 37 n=1 Tax=Erpetoichthys calabaricus TaxID=27687 RepID=UPI00223473E7|nr:protein phosphatase 1 regulatory subunit 37 [Erpetoichthys calabaricus]
MGTLDGECTDQLADPPQSKPKCKNNKRVSFPPDEELVSGFAEKKEVLKDVSNLTLQGIITSYKQSCEKHQVEPKAKLLEQLQDITDIHHRISSLDLKGELLTHQSCECLEEILKGLQFEIIDLQETKLDENGASALLDMILYYESATYLNISSNQNIGGLGWLALSQLIQKSSCLVGLDASNMPLLECPARTLSRALQFSRLTVLHLENCYLTGRPLFTLVSGLTFSPALQELYLAGNGLNGSQDSMQLGDLVKYNCSLKLLDLRDNHISDTGLEDICEGLRVPNSGLRCLVLWNNQLTHQSMRHLAKVLCYVKNLETLNLGKNALTNEGIQRLKDSLIINQSVRKLGLASTRLTCEGAVALAEFIAESRCILRLDVRRNLLRAGGLMALSLALRINKSLIRVDLDRTPKEEKYGETTQ